MAKQFDYIFAGAGMAALSVLARIMDDAFFDDKQILLLDRDTKQSNDRTWCFWEKEEGYFEDIVSKTWKTAVVKGGDETLQLPLIPYTYKAIRGIDFYEHVFERMREKENITFLQCEVLAMKEGALPTIETSAGVYSGELVFNSLFKLSHIQKTGTIPTLYQHFKGYVIKTQTPFEDGQVTFMDFSINQKDTMQFMYVLPFSKHSCLVEHTYFSQRFVQDEVYDTTINSYCNTHFGEENWKVTETEKGVIPMTRNAFKNGKRLQNIWPIGTLGGFTKASSGYTFLFAQKQAATLITELKEGKQTAKRNGRFAFYDALLLRVLAADEAFGHTLFLRLFKNHDPQTVFAFLNEESSIWQEMAIILKSPRWRFIKALLQELRA